MFAYILGRWVLGDFFDRHAYDGFEACKIWFIFHLFAFIYFICFFIQIWE